MASKAIFVFALVLMLSVLIQAAVFPKIANEQQTLAADGSLRPCDCIHWAMCDGLIDNG